MQILKAQKVNGFINMIACVMKYTYNKSISLRPRSCGRKPTHLQTLMKAPFARLPLLVVSMWFHIGHMLITCVIVRKAFRLRAPPENYLGDI